MIFIYPEIENRADYTTASASTFSNQSKQENIEPSTFLSNISKYLTKCWF